MSWKLYGAAAVCLLVCLPLFMYYKKSLCLVLGSCFKTLGTLCAAALAFIAASRLDPSCWVCFAALVLHAAADYILEFNMYVGAGFFLAGHICYIAFFTRLFPVGAVQLICALAALAAMAWLMYRCRARIGKKMPLMIVYGVVLCLMTACALGGFADHSTRGLLIALGGALFFLSDGLLYRRTLFPSGRLLSWGIMVTYYSAQLLIAYSCMI